MRDSKDNYNPLERHFGTLSCGMTFGESMLLKEQNTKRFFNAIAFNDVKVLQLDLRDFETMLTKKDRKIQSAKKAFL
jgi:CRP-like cAMP-binding protein